MVEQHHKIQVLLQEYGGLRTEIVHRTNNMYQLIAVGAVVLGFVLSGTNAYRIAIDVAIGAPALKYFHWLITRDIRKAARRLREIEKDVNARAGENLLVWETYFGGEVTGHWGRGRELPRPTESPSQPSH